MRREALDMTKDTEPSEEELRGLLEEQGVDVDWKIKYRESYAERYEQVKARRDLTEDNDLIAKVTAEVSRG